LNINILDKILDDFTRLIFWKNKKVIKKFNITNFQIKNLVG
jgi:hypothetical protein